MDDLLEGFLLIIEISSGIRWLTQSSMSGMGGSWWKLVWFDCVQWWDLSGCCLVGFSDEDLCGIFEMEVVSGLGHEVIMLSFSLLI